MQKVIKKLLQSIFEIFTILFLKDIEEDKLVGETIDLYKKDGFISFFTKIRFWDAPFIEIRKLVPPKGNIVDLGSGDGLLVNYLSLDNPKRKLIGIEINKQRHSDAQKGCPNTTFINASVLKKNIIPKADCVLMIHLLHHLPTKKDQEELIKNAGGALKKGGKLVIAEVSEKPIIKYLISWLTDAFIVPIIFENKLYDFSFHYRTKKAWKNFLKNEGFDVKVINASKQKPFSHIIFMCVKK